MPKFKAKDIVMVVSEIQQPNEDYNWSSSKSEGYTLGIGDIGLVIEDSDENSFKVRTGRSDEEDMGVMGFWCNFNNWEKIGTL